MKVLLIFTWHERSLPNEFFWWLKAVIEYASRADVYTSANLSGRSPSICCRRPFCRLKAPLGLSLLRSVAQTRTLLCKMLVGKSQTLELHRADAGCAISLLLLYRYGFTDGEEYLLIGTAIYFHLTKRRAKKTEEQAMDNLWLELPWWFVWTKRKIVIVLQVFWKFMCNHTILKKLWTDEINQAWSSLLKQKS